MRKLLICLALILAAGATTLYLSPAALLASVQFTERQLAGLDSRQVQVGEFNIHYYEGGPQGAETILMIHGFGADKDNWLRFSRPLTARYHVVALDLPGFGDSGKPEASYDVGTQVERLNAFAKAIGLHKLHLIGNSMGGHIAALYAARHPEEVLSVALLNNAGVNAPQASELFKRLDRGDANPLLVRNADDFSNMLDLLFVEKPPLPGSLKQYLAERAMASHDFNQKIFNQLRERYIPLETELAKIQVPTLLLWGDQDQILDVSSIKVMQPLLKQPTVVIMQACGHLPMIERPEETAEHYQTFLDSVKS
ncbi:MAG: alpha/beta fold hydrolase [Pseudomonadales bacterium]|nr:alpha/beta fold hydrolase [Pseudomonadales bacterium]